MQLASISVERYRSITKAYKIGLSQLTVLVGPNNEGKSNILRALATAMNVLTRGQLSDPLRARSIQAQYRFTEFYDWKRDFPLSLQKSSPSGQSAIVVEFELSNPERAAFKAQIKSKLSGTLCLRIAFDSANTATVTVHKKGPGAKVQSQKVRQIATFVGAHLRFEHIEAVRTARSAERIVENLVAAEMSRVERDPEYRKALEKIAQIQKPILDELSKSIGDTLRKFLPDIASVSVAVSQQNRYEALRKCDIHIDDGTNTLLQYKGDGVQSLAALGIMRHATETHSVGKNLVLAIEEPESHLHPTAIHELRSVLGDMSKQQQIVITTHNPLFVDRLRVSQNILVQDRKARPAKSIDEIRDILGVRAADNLRHAELVLIVEGDDDRIALSALLAAEKPELREALAGGTLAIDVLGGVGNLSYRLSMLRTALCLTHCFLDNDEPARRAIQSARDSGLLSDKYLNLASMLGRNDSELEDWYDPAAYSVPLASEFGIQLTSPRFRTNRKWSVRMMESQRHMGRPWDDALEARVKVRVARAIAAQPSGALLNAVRPAFTEFAKTIATRLTAITALRVSA